MLNPINVDPALSTADAEPVIVLSVENETVDSETLSSVSRETTSPAPVFHVEQERESEPDPVAEAVASAVEQWIGFDPAVHAVNPDGTPRLKVDGSYARKRGKGGRKSGADDTPGTDNLFASAYDKISSGPAIGAGGNTTQNPTASATVPQSSPTQAAPNLSSAQAATMLVIACTTVMAKLVGPEWHAEKPEQKALADATKIYLDSKGGLNVTPEMGLFIACSMYAVPRLAHENTRTKFGALVDWTRDRVAVLRARFKRG